MTNGEALELGHYFQPTPGLDCLGSPLVARYLQGKAATLNTAWLLQREKDKAATILISPAQHFKKLILIL